MSQEKPSKIQLRVVVPNKIVVDAEVDEVQLPGLDGYLGILPGHEPLNVALGEGEIAFRRGGEKETYSVKGGFAEITSQGVLVITASGEDEIERPFEE
ncbi:MAG: F0F1 ATP synthase subunit epsilon [Candidatus Aminicenantales bacterium]